MADISKITLPNGSTYDVKDATARTQISSEAATRKAADDSINNIINSLKSSLTGAMHYVGKTSTALTDGSYTSPIKLTTEPNGTILDNTDYTPKPGDVVIYQDKEFVYSTYAGRGVWNEFGSAGSFKALAFKDSASGSVTPSGTVSKPTFTGTAGTVSVKGNSGDISYYFETQIGSAVATYDSAGHSWSDVESDAAHILQGFPYKKIVLNGILDSASAVRDITNGNVSSVISVGTLPTFDATVNGETLSFNFNQGTLPSITSVKVVTGLGLVSNSAVSISPFCVIGMFSPKNHNNDITMTGTFTPQGTVSQPTFTGNASTVTVK